MGQKESAKTGAEEMRQKSEVWSEWIIISQQSGKLLRDTPDWTKLVLNQINFRVVRIQ